MKKLLLAAVAVSAVAAPASAETVAEMCRNITVTTATIMHFKGLCIAEAFPGTALTTVWSQNPQTCRIHRYADMPEENNETIDLLQGMAKLASDLGCNRFRRQQ